MEVADFFPHPLVRGGHLQTLIPFFFPGMPPDLNAVRRIVPLSDGDAVVLHDGRPPEWNVGDPVAILLHGLAGCHRSPYMIRIARRLNELGVRTFRMNARSAGDGMSVARFPYHAGRALDLHEALNAVNDWCARSPILTVGFSLGGVVMLNLAGTVGFQAPPEWIGLLAVCPPVDLTSCAQRLRRPLNRPYDWFFCRLLRRHLHRWRAENPNAPAAAFRRKPTKLIDFDDAFTAPHAGFESAMHYYRECSPVRVLDRIEIATTILASSNDPLAPAEDVVRAAVSSAVQRRVEKGGHLGFFGRRAPDGRRWMDSFVVAWVQATFADWTANQASSSPSKRPPAATGIGLPSGVW